MRGCGEAAGKQKRFGAGIWRKQRFRRGAAGKIKAVRRWDLEKAEVPARGCGENKSGSALGSGEREVQRWDREECRGSALGSRENKRLLREAAARLFIETNPLNREELRNGREAGPTSRNVREVVPTDRRGG